MRPQHSPDAPQVAENLWPPCSSSLECGFTLFSPPCKFVTLGSSWSREEAEGIPHGQPVPSGPSVNEGQGPSAQLESLTQMFMGLCPWCL